jgi:osmoprotectant transport system permease protein
MNTLTDAWHWLTDSAHWSGRRRHLAPARAAPRPHGRLPGHQLPDRAPVALVLGHLGKGGALAVNISNIGRAVPTFAVLVLLLLTPIGKWGEGPTVVALVLFAVPPLLTNAYVGMREVDRDVVRAARGMGMTGRRCCSASNCRSPCRC